MERYPSSKIAARMHFSTLKTALKMNKKCKNTKNCQYFGNGSKYHKLLKILALGAMFKF